MRHTETLHNQIHNAQKPFPENEALNTDHVSKHTRYITRTMYSLDKHTDARTISGVSCHPLYDLHHQLNKPPIVLANVNDGTLYMPI